MKILCPLINEEIDEYDCFETGTVAERLVKPNIGVGIKKIENVPNFKERCLACPNHKDQKTEYCFIKTAQKQAVFSYA